MNDHMVAVAALASLPRQTPARLRRVLAAGDPVATIDEMTRAGSRVNGIDPAVWSLWCEHADRVRHESASQCEASGTVALAHGDPGYPVPLLGDPWAPPVVFVRGDTSVLHTRRVGIVGTRHATRSGRTMARILGEDLSRAGVCVVSGLARGIDVESHVGAIAGGSPPVAVVASGCDVVYPPEHGRIWNEVAERGAVISEAPPGSRPTSRMFPQRNRILAALSEIVVVVESRARGGSMITVREAAKRGIAVMAMPGSPTSAASEGTNVLIAEGCAPVTDACDVMVALGLDTSRSRARVETRHAPSRHGAEILSAVRGTPRTADEIALATGHAVLDVAVALGRLEAQGWVAHSDGWWEAIPG